MSVIRLLQVNLIPLQTLPFSFSILGSSIFSDRIPSCNSSSICRQMSMRRQVLFPSRMWCFSVNWRRQISFFIQLNNTPPTLTNVTFTPPIFSINGGTYSPRDGILYLAANGGNGTVPAVWQADPKNLTSK